MYVYAQQKHKQTCALEAYMARMHMKTPDMYVHTTQIRFAPIKSSATKPQQSKGVINLKRIENNYSVIPFQL
jgi:hypothetical protein